MAENNIVFEDRFNVDDVDKDGRKFDRVSRITGTSDRMHITLDIASELYPIKAGESIFVTLAKSLVTDTDAEADVEMDADGEKVQKVKREMWRGGDQGLAEQFDYVLYGKVYKFDDSNKGENQTTAYCSFGGLLMALRGSYRHLAEIVVGENIYLLIRK